MNIPHYNKEVRVRPARPEDLDAVGHIGTKAFYSYQFGTYKVDNTLVVETQEGRLVAAMVKTPEPLWWGSASIPAAAVGAVATDPDEERRGYAGALVVGTIHHYREQGWAVSPLWPFSFAYYRKFGWELPHRDLVMRAWPDMLRRLSVTPNNVRPATMTDMDGIIAVYTQGAQQTNAQTHRSRANWDNRIQWDDKHEGGFFKNCLIHTDSTGVINGYLQYRMEGRKREQGKNLSVRELNGATLDAQAALLRACADLPEVVTVTATLPGDSLIPDLFPDRITITSEQRLMLRVIDIPKALGALRPSKKARGVVSYEVYDWVVSEERPVGVTVEFGDGQVSVHSEPRADALRCDIAAFSRLFSGGMDVGQGRALGVIEGGNPASDTASDALLRGRMPFRSHLEPG